MSSFISNLTDIPVNPNSDSNSKDHLKSERYIDALAEYIRYASTPTTLAIQGEWGSGKTSLMNQLQEKLCSNNNHLKPFYGVWLNMWKYSLMQKDSDMVLTSVINGMIYEVKQIIESNYKEDKSWLEGKFSRLKEFGKPLVLTGCCAAANIISNYVGWSSIFGGLNPQQTEDFRKNINLTSPDKIQKELEEAIQDLLDKDRQQGYTKKGFIFFIDDLDRIEPALAVSILELLKNIFESKNCIFILAIDYEVVVKGLVSKFGKLDATNERAFRSFFDKIIQLPFTMPISAYEIEDYVTAALQQIQYYTEAELYQQLDTDKDVIGTISDFIANSTGPNPRAMKRLFNSLSLIQIMQKAIVAAGDSEDLTVKDKLINFALVCIQIAYPTIYTFIQKYPVFIDWNDETANILHLPKINEVDELELNNVNDEWKRILFRMCKSNSYMANRYMYIAELLESIKKLINCVSSEEFEEILSALMGMSSVTNVTQGQKDLKKRIRLKSDDYYTYLKEIGIPDWGISFVKDMFTSANNACENNLSFANTKGKALSSMSIKEGGQQRAKVIMYQNIDAKDFYVDFPVMGSHNVNFSFVNKPSDEELKQIKSNYVNAVMTGYKLRKSKIDYYSEINCIRDEFIRSETEVIIFIGDNKNGKQNTFRLRDFDEYVLDSNLYKEKCLTEIQHEDSRFIYCEIFYSWAIDCVLVTYGLELNSSIYKTPPEKLSLLYRSAIANKAKRKKDYFTYVAELEMSDKFDSEGNLNREYVRSKFMEGLKFLKERIADDIANGIKTQGS